MFEAVKVALDPTPAQERLMLSHAGAARFAYNAGLAHVKAALDAGEKPEWSLFSLQHWWVLNRDTLAVDSDGAIWWHENSSMSYRSGLKALADALSNWSKSRKGKRKDPGLGSRSSSRKTGKHPGSVTRSAVSALVLSLRVMRKPCGCRVLVAFIALRTSRPA